ncbi:MAG: thermonuclease family protein [Desulfovibrio sp.]|nr:thermonuclease family protein [Desulfovibrio sp.]
MNSWKSWLALLLLGLGLAFFSCGEASARIAFVFKVENNGTISVSNWPNASKADQLVRMYGVMIPSLRQPFGKEAHAFLLKFLPKDAKIEIAPVGRVDEEGIEEVLVQVDGHSLNYALVDEGLAWVDRHSCKSSYCRRWYIVEHHAVLDKKGVWSIDVTTPPWQWSR